VRSAAAVSHLPLGGRRGDWLVEVEGRAPSVERTLPAASFVIASDDYFGTMGVPIAAGRGFTTRDAERAPPVAVVSQAMARVYWPGVSPVGRRFRLSGGGQMSFPWLEVVGVAGDVRSAALAEAPHPTYYLLDRQFPTYVPGAERDMTVLLRTTGDPLRLAGAARQRIWALDGELAVGSVRTLESVVSASVARPRFAALVLGAFGAAALALAVTGVYGVLSYAVTRRRREMGVRLALGARPSDVLRLVLGQGMRLALLGVVIGAAGALAGSRLLASLLFGVRAADPITFGAAALVLGAAAFIATFLPARRATRVPPALVLRAE
jgi:predicted permease